MTHISLSAAQDIADVRSNKIKQGLQQIPSAAIIKLNNISQSELNEIRGPYHFMYLRHPTILVRPCVCRYVCAGIE